MVEIEKTTNDIGVVKGNLVATLAYLGGILSAIFIILTVDNKFVRFHAIQSTITFVIIFVISMVVVSIPFVGWMISPLIWLLGFILYIFLMYQAYKGEKFKLPVIGDIADR